MSPFPARDRPRRRARRLHRRRGLRRLEAARVQAPRRATSYHRSTPSLQHAPLRMPPDFVQSCRGSECAPLRMGSRHHDKRGSTSRRSLLVHCAHADVLTLVHLSHSSHSVRSGTVTVPLSPSSPIYFTPDHGSRSGLTPILYSPNPNPNPNPLYPSLPSPAQPQP